MRKIVSILMVVAIVVGALTIGVCAEDVTFVDMAEMIADEANWIQGSANKKIEFKNGGVICSPESTFGYQGKKFTNEIFEFDVDFGDMAEGRKWGAFSFRADKPDTHPMWNYARAYSFIFRPTFIELQVRGAGNDSGGLGCYPCDEIKTGETVRVKFGAVNVKNGVQVFLFVNGKQVINYYHAGTENMREGGYFSVFNVNNTVTITPVSTKETKNVNPIVSEFEITRNDKTLELSYSTMYGDVEDITYGWYLSDKPVIDILLNDICTEGFYDSLKAVSTETKLELDDKCAGKHIFAAVKTKDYILFSNSINYSNMEHHLNKGIYMLADYERMYLNGKIVPVDENDNHVAPSYFDGEILFVPLRAVAEALNGEVVWDGATKAVSVKSGTKETKINIGTLNGGLTKEPFIDRGRTYVAFDDLQILLTGEFTVAEDGFIIVNNPDCPEDAIKELKENLEYNKE